MTAALAILAQIWPFLLAAAGVVFGLFRHKQAQTSEAQARQKEAEAAQQIAQQRQAEAQANADAQKAGSDATAARTDIDNQVSAKPTDEIRHELDAWTRR